MEYIIERRYEYMSRSGKTWCNWFTHRKVSTESEAKDLIKLYKKKGEMNKKLKGEYRITEVNE